MNPSTTEASFKKPTRLKFWLSWLEDLGAADHDDAVECPLPVLTERVGQIAIPAKRAIQLAPVHTISGSQLFFVTMSR